MEKVLHPYDKERMRLAMLKHEATFRQQVHELHRLYRIQKMLMDSVGVRQQEQQKQERYLVDSEKPFDIIGDGKFKSNVVMGLIDGPDDHAGVRSNGHERIAESTNGNGLMMFDENEIELTLSLGPSAHNLRQRRTDNSESGQSLSSSSTGSTQTRKTSPKKSSSGRGDKQFTLGSGNTNSTSVFPQGSESKPGFSNGQQTNPPWLFHALSLKLT